MKRSTSLTEPKPRFFSKSTLNRSHAIHTYNYDFGQTWFVSVVLGSVILGFVTALLSVATARFTSDGDITSYRISPWFILVLPCAYAIVVNLRWLYWRGHVWNSLDRDQRVFARQFAELDADSQARFDFFKQLLFENNLTTNDKILFGCFYEEWKLTCASTLKKNAIETRRTELRAQLHEEFKSEIKLRREVREELSDADSF